MFKRLKVVNDRTNGPLVKVGILHRGAADRRQTLNMAGTFVFKLLNGQDANLKVIPDRGKVPNVEIQVHGNAVKVPLTDLARSVKVDETGQLIRA